MRRVRLSSQIAAECLLDLERRQLIVIETVGEASGKIHTGVPKSTAGNRAIPIPQPLADLLAEHIKVMGLPGANKSRYLFPAPHGGPLRYSWWHEKVWDPARRTIGLPGLGFHDLRRFYATLLVETRADEQWRALHEAELLDNWQRAQEPASLSAIEPLQ